MTMHDAENSITSAKRIPWNKGKLTGAKPPLRPKHVWAIRTKLQIDQLTRDLALFNLAIDSKLRGCDVIAVQIDDVAPNGYAVTRRAMSWPACSPASGPRPLKASCARSGRQG